MRIRYISGPLAGQVCEEPLAAAQAAIEARLAVPEPAESASPAPAVGVGQRETAVRGRRDTRGRR